MHDAKNTIHISISWNSSIKIFWTTKDNINRGKDKPQTERVDLQITYLSKHSYSEYTIYKGHSKINNKGHLGGSVG